MYFAVLEYDHVMRFIGSLYFEDLLETMNYVSKLKGNFKLNLRVEMHFHNEIGAPDYKILWESLESEYWNKIETEVSKNNGEKDEN